jgi:hypothetical protein
MTNPTQTMTRDLVFSRVVVSFAISGNTQIAWSYHTNFVDPEPYTTQLQVGFTGSNLADDWRDVGAPQVNAVAAADTNRRYGGKEWEVHYRIKLVTPDGTYYSEPCPATGVLNRSDWLEARETVRQNRLLLNKFTGWEGFILKRKRVGDKADINVPAGRRARDPLTGEVISTKRPETAGTDFKGGFFAPHPAFIQLTEQTHYPQRGDKPVGQQDVNVQQGVMIAFPPLTHGDVFIHAGSDRRYVVRPVKTLAAMRGVDILLQVELRQVDTADPVYQIPMP